MIAFNKRLRVMQTGCIRSQKKTAIVVINIQIAKQEEEDTQTLRADDVVWY